MDKVKSFYRDTYHIFETIDHCVNANLIAPALCLIYSAIDSFAWIAYGDIPVKKRFMRFVDEHMYTEKPLEPNSLSLYAARCAILHTMSPESTLSKKGEAVPLNYAWGNADVNELKECMNAFSPEEKSCVHLSDLSESLRLGVSHFFEPDFSNKDCIARMKKHYSGLSPETVRKFNQQNA